VRADAKDDIRASGARRKRMSDCCRWSRSRSPVYGTVELIGCLRFGRNKKVPGWGLAAALVALVCIIPVVVKASVIHANSCGYCVPAADVLFLGPWVTVTEIREARLAEAVGIFHASPDKNVFFTIAGLGHTRAASHFPLGAYRQNSGSLQLIAFDLWCDPFSTIYGCGVDYPKKVAGREVTSILENNVSENITKRIGVNTRRIDANEGALKQPSIFYLLATDARQNNSEDRDNGCGDSGKPLISECFEYAGQKFKKKNVERGAFVVLCIIYAVFAAFYYTKRPL
jgi:hypothetical protein